VSENEIGFIVVDTVAYYHKKFTTNLTNQHELAVRKPFLTFKFHEIRGIKRGTANLWFNALWARLRSMKVSQQTSK